MLKQSQTRGRPPATERRGAIQDAALKVLVQHGYAGTTARAVAEAGGFNQALIFHHFGDMRSLLLSALDRSSELRLAAYGAAFAEPADLPTTVVLARRLYEEDVASGHAGALAQMVAAGGSDPELRTEIVARLAPWIEFAATQIERVVPAGPLGELVKIQPVAFALTAGYLGIELIGELEGSHARANELFDLMASGAGVLQMMFGNQILARGADLASRLVARAARRRARQSR